MFCRIISLTKTTWAYPPLLSEVVFFFARYPVRDNRPIACIIPAKDFLLCRELTTLIACVFVLQNGMSSSYGASKLSWLGACWADGWPCV